MRSYVRDGKRKHGANTGEANHMGLGSGLFQKLLFVMLFTLFITYVGFKSDFLTNFLIVVGLTVTSWLVVKLLWRFSK
jgi:hypothetical protein